MNLQLIQAHPIVKKYREAFLLKEDMTPDQIEYGMPWFDGINCGDGWLPLVELVAKKITAHNNYIAAEAKREWDKNLLLLKTGDDNPGQYDGMVFSPPVVEKIVCVKEKFGQLRIYADGIKNATDPYVQGIISMAESVAGTMCEDCGTTHDLGVASGGWIRKICKPCFTVWHEKRSDRSEVWVSRAEIDRMKAAKEINEAYPLFFL